LPAVQRCSLPLARCCALMLHHLISPMLQKCNLESVGAEISEHFPVPTKQQNVFQFLHLFYPSLWISCPLSKIQLIQ
ncbi:hypothetical protein HGM15179_010629, partial [Zosterops borbonicus]